jgi:hypothetical protein
MKFRHGFVSNSSSTSFVVLVPENFELTKDMISAGIEYTKGNRSGTGRRIHINAKDVTDAYDMLISKKALWSQGYNGSEYFIPYDAIEYILRDYVIAQMDTGPEDGRIILTDISVVRRILE